jgi:hypothetical protein
VEPGSPIGVAIRKDEVKTLPRMGGTDANIMSITGGDFPTRRHVDRLRAIVNKHATVNFVRVKSNVHSGTVVL